jgi:hypothetical protein
LTRSRSDNFRRDGDGGDDEAGSSSSTSSCSCRIETIASWTFWSLTGSDRRAALLPLRLEA